MSVQQKRGRKSVSPKDDPMEDVLSKLTRLNTGNASRVPAPAQTYVMDHDAAEAPRNDMDEAKLELIEQATKINRMVFLLNRYSDSLNTFLKKIQNEEKYQLYAHAVLPYRIKGFSDQNIKLAMTQIKALKAFPETLVRELEQMPQNSKEDIQAAKTLKKEDLEHFHRDTLNAKYSKLVYLPATLLMNALGSLPPKAKDIERWSNVITMFKRTFPKHSFTPLEMKYFGEWLNRGTTNSSTYSNTRYTYLSPGESEHSKTTILQMFGNEAPQYFGAAMADNFPKSISPKSDSSDDSY